MTAEIAIVNRSAITLAADSAITISVSGRRKIYQSADKIFELSEKDPIALMIYNNLEFMGAPLDVLIKQFRLSDECCQFSSLSDAPSAFFSYLTDKWKPSEENQYLHVLQVLLAFYEDVWEEFEKRGQRYSVNVLIECVRERVDKYAALPPAECFADVSEAEISDRYLKLAQSAMDNAFLSPPLDDETLAMFCRLGILSLHRNVFSALMSGLVFSGFGRDEVFPSLVAYHTDGIIADRLKIQRTEKVTTSRDEISAHVIPFAQREVVDRFLTGIDPGLEAGISDYFTEALVRTRDNIFNDTKHVSQRVRTQVLENLDNSLAKFVSEFTAKWLPTVKNIYSKETEDMVLFMPKPESSHLAEALVNLTSLKRKYSPDEESVAGPIDVAVISRGEGFVWVKRKHYFQQELNQRYFARKFGHSTPSKEDRDEKESL